MPIIIHPPTPPLPRACFWLQRATRLLLIASTNASKHNSHPSVNSAGRKGATAKCCRAAIAPPNPICYARLTQPRLHPRHARVWHARIRVVGHASIQHINHPHSFPPPRMPRSACLRTPQAAPTGAALQQHQTKPTQTAPTGSRPSASFPRLPFLWRTRSSVALGGGLARIALTILIHILILDRGSRWFDGIPQPSA